ncbi:sugar ABC transporter ATP-binding protein [Mesorhizobium denitrificans]|uniref:Sugar ABC transporter ATP-binding protein n=1 Tax=Mesorhizobium denitrificans TaxID=2294114 RepID=A0A371X9M3_9HYPH|nr:sugar ABC transporter ATP-binding protein [Mesorhizobium denitrificans]RFC65916.1 sugar ABC transporter ATP-binding protein [Mesorhizobium denitrificans]
MSDDPYRATGIKKGFGAIQVLHGVDFEVRPGTIHALLGHNGAGKSTLLKILAGAQQQDAGVLMMADEAVSFSSPRDALKKGVACVYQELRLIPNLTVAQNLFLGRELTKHGIKDDATMVGYARKLLADYHLRVDANDPVSALSHPEKQMVEVIANLDRKARFLFLDEPTTALDGNQARDMLDAVKRIATARQIGVVLVSHKLDEVLSVCDEVTVLSGGVVVLHAQGDGVSKEAIVASIVGHATHTTTAPPRRKSASGETFLEIAALSGPRLSSITLNANKGEILGIFGLVGSGRSRLLRTLYGTEPMTGGEIRIGGEPYQPVGPPEAMASGIAMLTEERKRDGFIPLMSALGNVVLPTLSRYRKAGLVYHALASNSARQILARIGTRGELGNQITALSGGNQQKVLFGRIIEQDARLILLDEPTKGVDIGAKADIYDIIRRLSQQGRCVVVVSSEEEELLELADRIVVFRHGTCDGHAIAADQLTIANLRREAWTAAAA